MNRRSSALLLSLAIALLYGWLGVAVTPSPGTCAIVSLGNVSSPSPRVCSAEEHRRRLRVRENTLTRACSLFHRSNAGLSFENGLVLLGRLFDLSGASAHMQGCCPMLKVGPQEVSAPCWMLSTSILTLIGRVRKHFALASNGLLTGISCSPELWDAALFPSWAPLVSSTGESGASSCTVNGGISEGPGDALFAAAILDRAGYPVALNSERDLFELFPTRASDRHSSPASLTPARDFRSRHRKVAKGGPPPALMREAVRRALYHAYSG
jgi:hypothetical protein